MIVRPDKKGDLLLLLLLVAVATILRGQHIISGHVFDGSTTEPLIGATVILDGKGTYADLKGHFSLAVYGQQVALHVSYLGYLAYLDTLNLEADTTILAIGLEPTANRLSAVTVSAGKYEQPLGETTVSIETLDPNLIAQSNTTSIDDVLDKVPGVAIIDGQANIRGGSGFSYGAGSRVLILVDDIPAYQADSGFPNWDDFPVENIASMEVMKGAASVLHGSAALNGTVNVRTAYATAAPKTKAFTFIRSYLAPRDRRKKWWDNAPLEYGVGFSDARRRGKFDLVNGLYYLDRNSFQKDNYNTYGRLNSKFRYKAGDYLELGLGLNMNKGKNKSFFFWKDSREGAYQGDTSNFSATKYFRFSVDPYAKIINDRGDRHEIKGRMFYVDNQSNANRSNRSTLYYGEYQFLKRLPAIGALFTVGGVGIHTDVNANLYGDTSFISSNYAAFFQIEKKFFDRLTLNAGMRYEKNTVKGPRIVNGIKTKDASTSEAKPVLRMGANYRLAPYTFFRASWGQGYRFPTIAEKYINTTFGGTLISPNLSLNSETGWSAEIGVKQGFKIHGFQGLLDVAAYRSEYFNMMEFVFTGLIDGFQSQNIGDTRIQGFDVSITGDGTIGKIPIAILGGYTYVDPTFQDFTERDSLSSSADYNILKYRSKHLWKVDVQTGAGKIDVGVSVQHTSNMEAVDAIFEIFIPGLQTFREEHKGYTITDLRAIYHLNDHIKLTALMRNVFNVEYSLRPGLLAAPRNFALRMDAEF